MTNKHLIGSSTADPATIRLAQHKDVAAVHRLLTQLAETLGEPEAMRSTEEDLVREGFGESPAFLVLLAERSDGPVGLTLFYYTFSSWRGRRGVYVQDLYVTGPERGTGLAGNLLAAVAAHGEHAGCTHLRLSVSATNAAGRRFYRKSGLLECSDEVICEIAGNRFARLSAALSQLPDEGCSD